MEVFREDVSSILSENITEDAIIFSTVNDMDSQSIGSLKVTMDNETLSFSMERNPLLEDMESSTEINTEELVPIETEMLITKTMDLPSASLVSSFDLPSLSASLDLQSVASLPSYLHHSELSPHLSNINSALLLETVVEPSIVISEPPPPFALPQRRKSSKFLEFLFETFRHVILF